jgi:hypothetical protein
MLIALVFLLTLAGIPADAGRLATRSQKPGPGCYLCLEPGRRNSGQSEPQTHTSKEMRPVSENPAGARSAAHSQSVWPEQRPATLGPELAERGGIRDCLTATFSTVLTPPAPLRSPSVGAPSLACAASVSAACSWAAS